MTKSSKGPYYSIDWDLESCPDAWCYIIVGGRNTGKTYSALTTYMQRSEPVVFLKRHNKDIDLLCAGNQLGNKAAAYEVDLSPYKPINRDFGTRIKAFKISDGLGAFYDTDEEGSAIGLPKGYLLSLFAIGKYKGFDLSECSAIIFDEFIPQPWDRADRKEGDQLMELYKTVSRDRTLRGRPELKLICLANAVNIFNYTAETLEITDLIADMSIHHRPVFYQEERGILIRILETPDEMMAAEQKTGIYKAMEGTAWGRMAFGNEFAYNDFSNIGKVALKGFRPIVELKHRMKTFYIYQSDTGFYMCRSRGKCGQSYNLNTEMGQRAFYYDYVITLLSACIDGRMRFETYSMYDMIVNYKKRFPL